MQPDLIIIAGVAGSGKTTIGQLLAAQIGFGFADADEFHSPASKAKMAAGQPLTDVDRAPWLAALRRAIDSWLESGTHMVLACSALKHSYRMVLQSDPDRVHFVFLKARPEVVSNRLSNRTNHFMKGDMLPSQFGILEEPAQDEALTVDASLTPQQIAEAIRNGFGLREVDSAES